MPNLKVREQPFYVQSVVIFFGIIAVFFVFWILADIMIPLAFALFLSVLLNPLVNWMQKHKVPRTLAILAALLLAIIIVGGLLYFLSTQIAQFKDSLPMLKQKSMQIAEDIQRYIDHQFGIARIEQDKAVQDAFNGGKAMIGQTIFGVFGILAIVILLPIYMFFILFYKPLILNFLYEVFAEENSQKVAEVLTETKSAIQSYIVGLLIETLIVGILNSVALLILGVPYAILIGTIGALLNLIPYLGGLVAITLPVLMATVSKDGYSTQLGVILSYILIQFIDNNILVPRIVSSKVQINALMSIIVVLLGNQIWGLPGMFLSIPFIAVLKIIFDRIDGLKPWGKLMGDTVPTRHMGERWNRIRARAQNKKGTVSST
jgi:predicted PurR-regulated permease PerM